MKPMDDLMLPPLPEPDYIDTGLSRRAPGYTANALREYAKKAVEAEREACAEKAKEIVQRRVRQNADAYGTAEAVRQAIRARR